MEKKILLETRKSINRGKMLNDSYMEILKALGMITE